MPSETFFCPHCNTQLTKSAQAYVLGELMNDKNASFICMGGPPAGSVTCPGCGRSIDTAGMIGGQYDRGEPIGWLASFGFLAFIWALIALGVWIFSSNDLGESAAVATVVLVGIGILGLITGGK